MTKAFLERINGPQHETALRVFMVIVLAHWAEHLFQAQSLCAKLYFVADIRLPPASLVFHRKRAPQPAAARQLGSAIATCILTVKLDNVGLSAEPEPKRPHR